MGGGGGGGGAQGKHYSNVDQGKHGNVETRDQGKHYANVEIRLRTKAGIMPILKSDWGPRQTLCQCWNQTGDQHGHVEIWLGGPRLLKSNVGPRQILRCPNQTGDQGKHSCSDRGPRQRCKCWNQTEDQAKNYAKVEISLGTKANIMPMLKSVWGLRQTLCQCWNQSED